MAVAATMDPVWSLTTPVIFASNFSTSGNSDNENCNEQSRTFLIGAIMTVVFAN
jgi:hypothetical protein